MKSILVHLDASPRAAERLTLAQRLAAKHGAEVTVVYAVTPSLLAIPWAMGEGMAMAAGQLVEVDQSQRDRARALFDRALTQGAMSWHETSQEPLYQPVAERALYADLMVLGQSNPTDLQTGVVPADLVPSLVADSGKPALVVPHTGQFADMGHEVVLAWKPTREAARAAHAALPLLRSARRVHLAYRADSGDFMTESLQSLTHWLRLQGVDATLTPQRLSDDEVGAALLAMASTTGSGLLVMGCYGHSRAREWILGGATRTILNSMTVPVLMAH